VASLFAASEGQHSEPKWRLPKLICGERRGRGRGGRRRRMDQVWCVSPKVGQATLRLLLGLNSLLLVSAWIVDFNNPIVHTQYGSIRGKIDERKSKFNRRPICTFLSIPYARPPVGSNRFLVSIEWRLSVPLCARASDSGGPSWANQPAITELPLTVPPTQRARARHQTQPKAARGAGRLAELGRAQQARHVSPSGAEIQGLHLVHGSNR